MDSNASPVVVRRAVAGERQAVIDVIETAFSRPDRPRSRLSEEMPHLFHETRIPNHFVGVHDGRIVGVVGLYPHQLRIRDVVFNVAGVGQVATLPEARGGGVMKSILAEVCRAADPFDFAWLHGDRQRYGRYGWEVGGVRHGFETYDKYLPTPPAANKVRVLEPRALAERLKTALPKQPQAILFPDDEVAMLCAGERGRSWCGWELGESFVLLDDDTIIFADGIYEELVQLVAFLATEIRKLPGDHWKVTLECDAHPTPWARVCWDYHWNHRLMPAASFRIGNLHSFLTKACQVAQPYGTDGADRLELTNRENQQQVTLRCEQGRLSVQQGAGAAARTLTTRELSGVCFGNGPLDLLLPGLSPASPFRRVLPLPAGICRIFSL